MGKYGKHEQHALERPVIVMKSYAQIPFGSTRHVLRVTSAAYRISALTTGWPKK